MDRDVSRFSVRFVSTVLIVLLGALALSVPALAQGGLQLDMEGLEVEGVTLEVVVDETGDWVADLVLKGLSLTKPAKITLSELVLEDQSPKALAETFGLEGIPTLDPEQVVALVEMDCKNLALRKMTAAGEHELQVFMNDGLLMKLQLSDGLVDAAVAELGPMMGLDETMSSLVSQLLGMESATIIIHLPGQAPMALDFPAAVAAPSMKPLNVVELGATLATSEYGASFVSVAGFTADEVNGILQASSGPGMMMPRLATTLFSDLGIKEAVVTLGAGGLEMDAGGGLWAKFLWDDESRQRMYDMVPVIGKLQGGYLVMPAEMPIVDDILAASEARVKVYIGGDPMESLPMVKLGRPFMVEVAGDGAVTAAGLPAGMNLAALAPYVPMAVRLGGGDIELKAIVNGETELPYLFVADGGLEVVAAKALPMANMGALVDSVPWGKVEDVLGGLQIDVFVLAEGDAPPAVDLSFAAEAAEVPAMWLVPQVVVDPKGNVGVGEPPVRISGVVEEFGVDVSEMVWPWVSAYGGIAETVTLVVNNSAITISVDQAPVLGIKWDAALRENVLGFVPIPALPGFVENMFPDWETRLVEALVQAQWGVQIKVVDEIPPAGFEGYVKDIQGLLGGIGF